MTRQLRWRADRGKLTHTGWVVLVWGILSLLFSIVSIALIIWAAAHFIHKYW